MCLGIHCDFNLNITSDCQCWALFMGLLNIHKSFVKCLFKLFAHIFIELLVYYWVERIHYIFCILMSDICQIFVNIFSQIVDCTFIYFIEAQFIFFFMVIAFCKFKNYWLSPTHKEYLFPAPSRLQGFFWEISWYSPGNSCVDNSLLFSCCF